jgi:putative transposase
LDQNKNPNLSNFAWQGGYGIFSVSYSQLATVREYIATQEAHHEQLSFQDEFRRLLQHHRIDFDERYVWD